MTSLKAGTSSSGSSLGTKVAEAVWGVTGRIESAIQDYEKKLGDYEPDIFITLTIDSGKQYPDEVDLFGSFGRDERTGEITGWGSAFKVDQVLNDLGAYDGLSEEQKEINNGVIPPDALEAIRGMRVHYLLYCSGKNPNKDKPVYNTYWKVLPASENTDPQTAWEQIFSSLQGEDYHMNKLVAGRNYLSEYIARQDDTSFDYGANRNQGGLSAGESQGPNEPEGGSLDDDLPI